MATLGAVTTRRPSRSLNRRRCLSGGGDLERKSLTENDRRALCNLGLGLNSCCAGPGEEKKWNRPPDEVGRDPKTNELSPTTAGDFVVVFTLPAGHSTGFVECAGTMRRMKLPPSWSILDGVSRYVVDLVVKYKENAPSDSSYIEGSEGSAVSSWAQEPLDNVARRLCLVAGRSSVCLRISGCPPLSLGRCCETDRLTSLLRGGLFTASDGEKKGAEDPDESVHTLDNGRSVGDGVDSCAKEKLEKRLTRREDRFRKDVAELSWVSEAPGDPSSVKTDG